MTTKDIVKIIVIALTAIATALATAFGLSSCNAVRSVTTSSSYYNKGDTSVFIQTKTIESYTAEKK